MGVKVGHTTVAFFFFTKVSFRRVAESIFGVSFTGWRRMQDEAMAVRMDYKKKNKKRKVRRHDQLLHTWRPPEGRVDKATKIGTIRLYCTYKECEHRGIILGSKSKKGCRVESIEWTYAVPYLLTQGTYFNLDLPRLLTIKIGR